MTKKGFTLVELLVSIVLFGLISMLLFSVIDTMRKQLFFFQAKELTMDSKNLVLSLFRSDFNRPLGLKIINGENKNFSLVMINGSNRSLYGIDHPNVAWVVLKHNTTLVRLESAHPIALPIKPELQYLVHSDVIATDCEIFRVYESAKNVFVYLKIENQKSLIIETQKE